MEKLKSSIRGPIAEKVIRAMHKANRKKVIDFKAWKIAKDYQGELKKEREKNDLSPARSLCRYPTPHF